MWLTCKILDQTEEQTVYDHMKKVISFGKCNIKNHYGILSTILHCWHILYRISESPYLINPSSLLRKPGKTFLTYFDCDFGKPWCRCMICLDWWDNIIVTMIKSSLMGSWFLWIRVYWAGAAEIRFLPCLTSSCLRLFLKENQEKVQINLICLDKGSPMSNLILPETVSLHEVSSSLQKFLQARLIWYSVIL